MPFKKKLEHCPRDVLTARGVFKQDWDALTPCQRECSVRFAKTTQIEQESYMTRHPEVLAILKMYVASLASTCKRKMLLPEIALHFTKPAEEMITEIESFLGVRGSQFIKPDKEAFTYNDTSLEEDLKNIVNKHYPPKPWDVVPSPVVTPDTVSSTFISIQTSNTTLPTPEPIPTPEPTMEEIIFNAVSNTVDKAIFMNVNEKVMRYDIAYVELMKAVEDAMEIPVIEIKADIAEIFFSAYKMFELIIMEKQRQAAELAWEKRMRKKLKHTLRLQNNFRGYETPPTPKSVVSSHESYRIPPQKPCHCHPQWRYNRYHKDRFGVYMPSTAETFDGNNLTVTPALSMDDVTNVPTVTPRSDVAESTTSKKTQSSVTE